MMIALLIVALAAMEGGRESAHGDEVREGGHGGEWV